MSQYWRQASTEPVRLSDWQPDWPAQAAAEAAWLKQRWPQFFSGRIEHFGSTAIPGMPAKPIIDLLVEVADLAQIRDQAAPLMAAEGYQLFWRPKIKGEQQIEVELVQFHGEDQEEGHEATQLLVPCSEYFLSSNPAPMN